MQECKLIIINGLIIIECKIYTQKNTLSAHLLISYFSAYFALSKRFEYP